MLERFQEIKSGAEEKIGRFLGDVLGIPPSLEKAVEKFPHNRGCSRTEPLELVVKTVREIVPKTDPREPSFSGIVTKNFMECGECGVRKQFSR